MGASLDDAAGEAFDKTANCSACPTRAGLARIAETATSTASASRPMTDRPGLDFSFSGLKTRVLTEVRRQEAGDGIEEAMRADIARAFEEAVVDTQASRQAGSKRPLATAS